MLTAQSHYIVYVSLKNEYDIYLTCIEIKKKTNYVDLFYCSVFDIGWFTVLIEKKMHTIHVNEQFYKA